MQKGVEQDASLKVLERPVKTVLEEVGGIVLNLLISQSEMSFLLGFSVDTDHKWVK